MSGNVIIKLILTGVAVVLGVCVLLIDNGFDPERKTDRILSRGGFWPFLFRRDGSFRRYSKAVILLWFLVCVILVWLLI